MMQQLIHAQLSTLGLFLGKLYGCVLLDFSFLPSVAVFRMIYPSFDVLSVLTRTHLYGGLLSLHMLT